MENKSKAAERALLLTIKDQARLLSRESLEAFLKTYELYAVDAFIEMLGKNQTIDVLPRAVQGANGSTYEFRIKHKGKLLVQADEFKDLPTKGRLAEKFRQLAKNASDIADIFEE